MRTPTPGDKFMFFAPTEFSVGIAPNGNISLGFGRPDPAFGFDPSIIFAAELSPDEARRIADLLARKADEAQAGRSRH